MPEALSVTAQVPANEKKGTKQLGPVTINVKTGKDVKEMIEMFDNDSVKSNAEANWIVTLQSNIRAGLRRGETADQIQARLADAKMGVASKGVKIDPVQAFLAKFQASTPAEQQQMLADLKKRAAAK